MARARAWGPQFALLPPALADRKLCEYTRVLQLSALEQRVYAKIEAKRATPEPVGLLKKGLAWLTVAVLTLFPMFVPMPHRATRCCRPPNARPRPCSFSFRVAVSAPFPARSYPRPFKM
jgi:hypothetical protein